VESYPPLPERRLYAILAILAGGFAVPAEDVAALVEALAAQPGAVVPLASLPERLSWDTDALGAALAEAVNAGKLSMWPDAPEGPAVILSAASAEALGVELVTAPGAARSDRWLATMRWVKKDHAPPERPDRRHQVARRLESEVPGGFDSLPDPKAGDLDEAAACCACANGCLCDAATEKIPRWRRELLAMGMAVYKPTLLLGLAHQWPVEPDSLARCGVCHEAELGAETVCLYCCRSGIDALLPEVPARERPRPVLTPYRDGLAGGQGEAASPPPKPPSALAEVPGGWRLRPPRASSRPRRSIHSGPGMVARMA
jgi:hypothetical protein